MESYATSENECSQAQESAAAPIETPISDDAQRTESPEVEKSKKMPTKLYVGNLSAGTNRIDLRKDLREMFQIYGQVSDVDVVGSFAFVVMPNEAEAEEAIKALHDKKIGGKILIVEKKKQRAAAAPAARKADRGRGHRDIQLFAARCKEISEEKLTEVFERFGSVVSVKKPRTKPDLAFVAMEHFFQARKAVEALNRRRNVEGLAQPIFVQLSTNNLGHDGRPLTDLLERGETIKLFVGNLDAETEAKELGVLFERYGPVFDVAVIKGKGFGFVHMLSRESADDAVRGLDRTDFKKKNISVSYSFKKGMTIGRPARVEPGSSFYPGNPAASPFGRMGAKSMAPRLRVGRDESGMPRQQQQQQQQRYPPRYFPETVYPNGHMDPLAALQRQINSQYLSTRAALSAPYSSGSASLSSFNLDAVFPRDLRARYQPPLGLSRSPDRRDVDARFPADDRSRFANFVGSGGGGAANARGISPQKRGRSPPMRGVRFSPSPKRNMTEARFFPKSAPREDRQRQTGSPSFPMVGSEFAMRRSAAQTVPPKIRGPQVTRVL